MLFIAHRGNLTGPHNESENTIVQIKKALSMGLDVEIDVWYKNNHFFLGHDHPQEKIAIDFLRSDRLWCHAKNIEALYEMLKVQDIRCFFHDKDDSTLTSKNEIWTYPGRLLTPGSICVLPELSKYSLEELNLCKGICTDYPLRYKEMVQRG